VKNDYTDFLTSDIIKIKILKKIAEKDGMSKRGIKSSLSIPTKTADSAIKFLEMIGAIEVNRTKHGNRPVFKHHMTEIGASMLNHIHYNMGEIDKRNFEKRNTSFGEKLEEAKKGEKRFTYGISVVPITTEDLEKLMSGIKKGYKQGKIGDDVPEITQIMNYINVFKDADKNGLTTLKISMIIAIYDIIHENRWEKQLKSIDDFGEVFIKTSHFLKKIHVLVN
jgi:hypothetical protein